jgi:hypothetical protein
MTPTFTSWYQLSPRFSGKPGHSVLVALIRSGLPGVPATFREVIESSQVREDMWVGACPRWTNDSRTTLHVCSSAYRPGLLHRGVPPQASPLRPVAAEGVRALRFHFPEELAPWLCVAANATHDKTNDGR